MLETYEILIISFFFFEKLKTCFNYFYLYNFA